MVAVLAAATPSIVAAQGAEDIGALDKQVFQLYGQGKYKEADAIAEKALALAERVLGREHPDTLRSVSNLATLYCAQGRYGEAEPLYKRALEGFERTLGPGHQATKDTAKNLAELYRSQGREAEARQVLERLPPATAPSPAQDDAKEAQAINAQLAQLYKAGKYAEVIPLAERYLEIVRRLKGENDPDTLQSLHNLAFFYQAQGRYAEAEPLFKRALAARERVLGPDNPGTLASMAGLGLVYKSMGRYTEAEPLYKRSLAATERVLGKEHSETLTSLNNLAVLYQAEGRFAEAEPLFKRTLEARRRVLGPEHPDTLQSLNNLAFLYQAEGRAPEAEPLYKRALEAKERVLGKEHPETLASVNNLAFLYKTQGRYAEAEPLYKRALDAFERVLGKEHPDTLLIVNNLAELYRGQNRLNEAEPLYKRAIEAYERVLGPDHPDTLRSVNNLALLYIDERRYVEAEPLSKRLLEARERVLGKDHPDTLTSVNNLAGLYYEQGRYAEAEPLYRRAIEARERVLGSEHPDTILSVHNLAGLFYRQQDWGRAAQLWRRSTRAIVRRTQRGVRDTGQALTGKKKSEAEQWSRQFRFLVRAAFRLAPEGRAPDAKVSRETFRTSQWAQSSAAAASLAEMAARGAKRDPKLSPLVRERQDLVSEWQKRDRLRNEWLGGAANKRDPKAEAENNARLAAIDARIGEIDKELAVKFPDYAALASGAPLPVEEVQAELRPGEALVLFLDTKEWEPTPEETFIWVVTKADMRWVRSDLGTESLSREVQALRCGLDLEAWADRPCAELTGQNYTEDDRNAGRLLPFDHARAYRLYQALFGQVEDLIKGKELILVPSGPLTQLPFQVLETAAPQSGNQRAAAWLIREHALTVLPAVSSLKALRRVGRASAARQPMIGFGDPLLDGDPDYADDRERAQRARDFKSCPETAPQRLASLSGPHRGVAAIATRGGLASVDFLRMQAPLPETADELCAVARDLNADPGEIYLGARATEREVERLSESGQLAQYRIVHFATHGALAGQIEGNSEPGLLLTPPAEASEEDDGYLTASEIAGLKLDADWVILSACNTAAGGAEGAEALSGLARAFFYAQARALLVSHWEVASDATVKLITGAMRRLAADKSMGRAEAMRQSMLDLIDHGERQEAHPAFWAPFALVGEGAAAR